jgi:hypothetical protein
MGKVHIKPLASNIITHPAHYIEGRVIEPITVIEEYGLCHHMACVVKYIARAGRKTSIINDLLKSSWYLDRELQRCSTGVISCLSPLNTKPPFSIQEILEDWSLSAHLDAALPYILAARLGTNRNCSHKDIKNHISSLTKAMGFLQLAIFEHGHGHGQGEGQ